MDIPSPTLHQLKCSPVRLEQVRLSLAEDEYDVAVDRLREIHRNAVTVRLGNIRFDSLVADPEISMLEEREGRKNLLYNIQYACAWDAYAALCLKRGVGSTLVKRNGVAMDSLVKSLTRELHEEVADAA